LQFGADEAPDDVGFSAFLFAGDKTRRLALHLSAEQLQAITRSGRIGVDVPHEIKASFELSQLAKVLELGTQCAVGLGELWGFTREEQAAVAMPPQGNVAAQVDSGDYPSEALRNNEGGQARVRLSIDTDGRVSDCVVITTSGTASIDETTCRVASKARFKPALDANGRPVRSLAIALISWLPS
jgi:TonB family protein